MDVLMKYNKDMRGKEVIDGYGNVLGKVTDIEWDESTRQLKNFEIGNGGFMEMLGRGDKKILSFDIVDAIGEKILIKTGATEPVKEDISKVKNISRVKNILRLKSLRLRTHQMLKLFLRLRTIQRLKIVLLLHIHPE